MNFNIARTLDYEMLDKKIKVYECENNGDLPYIFISSETANEMTKHDFNKGIVDCSKTICRYMGCNVYLDDDLEYGEIELR